MSISFTDTGTPNSQALQAFEDSLPARLPSDYREFLSLVNGGKPCPSAYYESDLNDDSSDPPVAVRGPDPILNDLATFCVFPSRISVFYGIGRERIEENIDFLLMGHQVTSRPDASSLFPIAGTGVGTSIYMSLSNEHYGWVFDFEEDINFDDEWGEPTSLAELSSRVLLAKSFSGFLRTLFPARVRFTSGFRPTNAHILAIKEGEFEDPT